MENSQQTDNPTTPAVSNPLTKQPLATDNQQPPQTPATPSPQQVEPITQPPTTSPKNKLPIKVIIGLIIVLVLATASYYTYQYFFNKPTPETPTPTPIVTQSPPIPTIDPATDPTANWETYSLGRYTFKVPLNFTQDGSATSDIFSRFNSSTHPTMQVELILSGAGYGIQCAQEVGKTLDNIQGKSVEITTYQGLEPGDPPCVSDNSTKRWVLGYLNYPEDLQDFLVLFADNPEVKNGVIDNLFNQILSTFKFLDQTSSTNNWEIYTNLELGFSIKLPATFSSFVASEGPEAGKRVDFAIGQPVANNKYWYWILINPNSGGLTAKEVADNYLINFPDLVSEIERENTIVAGTSAFSLYPVPSLTDTKFVYVVNEKTIFTIALQAGTLEELNDDTMNSFNQILSTFEFIE